MSNAQRREAIKRRKRLFRENRPHVREMTDEDLGILWAQHNATAEEPLSAEVFNQGIRDVLARFHGVMMVEDRSPAYPDGWGPVAFLGLTSDGWKVEPTLEYFKWASPRNILRSSVAVFRWFQTSRDVGVCLVRSDDKMAILMRKLKKYGVLFPVGKIPYGLPTGHEYLFYVKGKRDGSQ